MHFFKVRFGGELFALALLATSPAWAVSISLVRTNVTVPAGRTLQIPVSGTDTQGLPLKFSIVSVTSAKLKAVFAPSTNRWLRLNVSGVDAGATTGSTGLEFDGQQSDVRVPYNAAFYQAPFTAECWVNLAGGGADNAHILANYTDQQSGWAIFDDSGVFGIELTSTDQGSQSAAGHTSSRDGAWHHLALVVDGATATLYVDGTAETSISYSGSVVDQGNDLLVGNRPALDAPLAGIVDEIRFSSVVRDLTAECPAGVCATNLGSDASTVGYWKFDEGAGGTASDSTGNGNNGTLEGSPAPVWVAGVGAPVVPFTGQLLLQLFDDLTPHTTARIEQLVTSGFYNGLTFHRVIQDFMAQGGDPTGTGTGGSGVTFDDEFVLGLTYTGFGQLAMANSGPDSNDSQFFITDADLTVNDSTKPSPTWLNFRNAIFGQLVRGFDVLTKMVATPVDTLVQAHLDRPFTPLVITSAAIVTNSQDAVLRVSAANNFIGSAKVTVMARNAKGLSAKQTLVVNVVSNTVNDPSFLGPMPASLVVTQNVAASFILTVLSDDSDPWTGGLYDMATGQYPTQVPIDYDSKTSRLWFLPDTNFAGTVNMALAVTDYDATGDTYNHVDQSGNPIYDTQQFSLTVLPISPTPTMTIVPRSGLVQIVTNKTIGSVSTASNDVLRISGSFTFNDGATHHFGSNDIVQLTLGDPANPIQWVLYPYFTGWSARGGVINWHSAAGSKPNVSILLNSVGKTFTISATGFDFPAPFTSANIQVGITVGNQYGSDTRAWVVRPSNTLIPPPVH